jgi:tripartite-type tricarboxylate transporter receptor subunit TctC
MRFLIYLTGLLAACLHAVSAQAFPDKPIRFILPYPPGGATDIIARIFTTKLAEAWGQQVIIDHRGGGASIVGTELAAKAAPDGYTMLMGTFGFAITPILHKKLPYDIVRDFTPVGLMANGLLVLVVHPGLPVQSVKDLIAYAKSRPGQLNYGSTGGGSGSNMAALLFQSMTVVRMTGVPYNGAGPSLVALLGGELNLIFSNILPTTPHVKAGKLRALGVSSIKRSIALPDIPTIAEAGVAGFETLNWYSVLVPRGTPQPIVSQLNGGIVRAAQSPEVREQLVAQGLEPAFSSPQDLARYIAAEIAKWSRVVRETGAIHD